MVLTGKRFFVNENIMADEAYQLTGRLVERGLPPVDCTCEMSR